jgi:hypothetical protein
MIATILKSILIIWIISFGVFAFLIANYEVKERKKNNKK